jgi:hypothetical protein
MPAVEHKTEASARRGPRPRGAIRSALVQAGMALARSGGPDAVVLLAAVSDEAVGELAQRMAARMAQVRAGPHTPTGARLRLRAVGQAYLEFARTESGLFDTAFAAADRHPPSPGTGEPGPLQHLQSALDNLVAAGILSPARRPGIEYPTWATVHGLAVLLRGPLSSLTDREKTRLEAQTLTFIGASVS